MRTLSSIVGSSFHALLALALISGSFLQSQEVTREGVTAPLKVASQLGLKNGKTATLTLYRQSIPALDDIGLLRYLSQHRDETSFPNTAFFLVASQDTASSGGDIVWAKYVFVNTGTRPREVWAADLAHGAPDGTAYPVLARSIGWHVDFSLFAAKVDQSLGTFPARLDPLHREAWPVSAPPQSTFSTTLVGREISGLSGIEAHRTGAFVAITGKRDLSTMPSVYFRFSLKENRWSQMANNPDSAVDTEKNKR